MTDQSLTNPNPNTPQNDQSDDLFSPAPVAPTSPQEITVDALVGEGKKFATVDDLARGKAASDAYIARLESEQEQLRAHLSTATALEDLVDRAQKSQRNTPADSQPAPAHQPDMLDPNQQNQNLTKEEVEAMLNDSLRKQAETQNLQHVRNELEKVYGTNFKQHIEQRAAELGWSTERANEEARKEPKVFLALFGKQPGGQPPTSVPPVSQVNTGAHGSQGSRPKTFSDYEQLRKEKPSEYFSAENQKAMFEAMKEMGEDFLK